MEFIRGMAEKKPHVTAHAVHRLPDLWDCPSTPAAPLFALTLLYASHTSLFEMPNDLSFGSDLPTRVLPDHVRLFARTKATDEPAPSLRLHYREFITTTSWSASAAATVLDASQFLLLDALPLAPAPLRGKRAQYRHAPSHVSCSSRRSDSRRLRTGHRLANKRAPARLIPETYTIPGFDAVSYFSTLHQRIAYARLSDPCLTTLTPPFPQSLPTTVFSQGNIEAA